MKRSIHPSALPHLACCSFGAGVRSAAPSAVLLESSSSPAMAASLPLYANCSTCRRCMSGACAVPGASRRRPDSSCLAAPPAPPPPAAICWQPPAHQPHHLFGVPALALEKLPCKICVVRLVTIWATGICLGQIRHAFVILLMQLTRQELGCQQCAQR